MHTHNTLIMSNFRMYMSGHRSVRSTYSMLKYTDDGSIFHSMPPMPEVVSPPKLLVLESGNIFVLSFATCFLYESDRNKWKPCPDMYKKTAPSCGVVKRRNGKEEIVVAGGMGDSTVYIFSPEECSWRTGVFIF